MERKRYKWCLKCTINSNLDSRCIQKYNNVRYSLVPFSFGKDMLLLLFEQFHEIINRIILNIRVMIFILILEKIYHLIYVQFSLSVFYLEKIFNLRLFFKNVLIHEITKREIARIHACFFRLSSLFVWIMKIFVRAEQSSVSCFFCFSSRKNCLINPRKEPFPCPRIISCVCTTNMFHFVLT